MSKTFQNFDVQKFSKQLSAMLELQDAANRITKGEDWSVQGLAWHRAVYVEAGEFLEHLGNWKWWKNPSTNLPQALIELVDIWHFALSWYIVRFGQPLGSEALTTAIARRVKLAISRAQDLDDLDYVNKSEEAHKQVDKLVAKAGLGLFDTDAFVQLMGMTGLDFDAMFRAYVPKNVLHVFRQRNGYKTGTYIKTWHKEEDNVHLERVMAELNQAPEDQLPVLTLEKLTTIYQGVQAAASKAEVA